MNFFRNAINRIRRFIRRRDPEDTEYEWVKVGEVFQSIVYPLWESPQMHVQDAVCTSEGLMFENVYDGSFIIYRTTTRVACSAKELQLIKQIKIRRIDGLVTLEADLFHSVEFDFKDEGLEKLPVIPIWMHGPDSNVILVRECGKVASEWVAEYLSRSVKGFRLGYYIESDQKAYFTSRSKPMALHINANNRYSILNLASFDKINEQVECVQNKVMEFDFRPNIIIETEKQYAFKEFSWKNIKINNCTFEITASCNECRQNQIQIIWDKLDTETNGKQFFLHELRSRIKKSTRKTLKESEATLTIDMKLTSDRGPIKTGDPVYFRSKGVN